MFDRLFELTVRNGPRILFAIALLVFAFGAVGIVWNVTSQPFAGGNVVLAVFNGLWTAAASAITPLIAAIVLERYPPRK